MVRTRTTALVISLVIVGVILGPVGGLKYYAKSPSSRAQLPLHRWLRPSGLLGRPLGLAGTALMLAMQLYSLRKRTGALGELGSVPRWLEFHVLCGILGPVLITLHTSFKFNGGVTVAYWLMIVVTLSGFVGRYLYVRIPKSLRGQELTHDEAVARAAELAAELVNTTLPVAMLRRVEAFEEEVIPAAEAATTWTGLLLGDFRLRRRLSTLRSQLRQAGLEGHVLEAAASLAAERATLLRRIAYLRKTKRLFEIWHVFHRPLAVLMAVVVLLHLLTVAYLGYAF